MFIHFFCLCPLGLATKLNFNISKEAYCSFKFGCISSGLFWLYGLQYCIFRIRVISLVLQHNPHMDRQLFGYFLTNPYICMWNLLQYLFVYPTIHWSRYPIHPNVQFNDFKKGDKILPKLCSSEKSSYSLWPLIFNLP